MIVQDSDRTGTSGPNTAYVNNNQCADAREMMLRVTIQDSEETVILHCIGRIVRGEEADTLRSAVMSQQHREVVMLNLEQVDVIDGGGLGLLISLQASGICLQLLNPSKYVYELLRLTRLDRAFEIHWSENSGDLTVEGPDSGYQNGSVSSPGRS
jgi:anti-anti-sigma factor